MKRLVLVSIVMFAACGGKQTPTGSGSGSGSDEIRGVATDSRTEIEKRRDGACETLKPKLVQCAVDDARAELEAGRMSKAEFEKNTASEVKAKLGSEWMKACRVPMSSRQVRVLEVCFKEEPQCGPLLSCLEHLNDGGQTK